ncbi:unnamed protein product [Orchesella dallaii]|uniref:VOC domain-containing protein n=1 Tax=Orchesella dallaii TaxID=48710 RepID=A0ABP1RKT8_9HEXA
MYRIKDPRRFLEFYTKGLGMTLFVKTDFLAAKFSLYFMVYEPKEDVPKGPSERANWAMTRKTTLELLTIGEQKIIQSNHITSGTKTELVMDTSEFSYCFVYEACKRFEEIGVEFVKKPDDDGLMNGLAFIKDPNDCRIVFTTKCIK